MNNISINLINIFKIKKNQQYQKEQIEKNNNNNQNTGGNNEEFGKIMDKEKINDRYYELNPPYEENFQKYVGTDNRTEKEHENKHREISRSDSEKNSIPQDEENPNDEEEIEADLDILFELSLSNIFMKTESSVFEDKDFAQKVILNEKSLGSKKENKIINELPVEEKALSVDNEPPEKNHKKKNKRRAK